MSTHAKRVVQMRKTLEGVYHEDLRASRAHLTRNSYPNSLTERAALKASIGPVSVTNGHMPLAANEVAQLRDKATLGYVLTALVNLGATVGFVAFVLFLLTRVGS